MSKTYHYLQRFTRSLLQTFFRKVRVTGLENIPADRGGLLISWHPNGMIDPGLIFSFFPYHIVFGARHGLFSWPILGTIMKNIGTVAIYRGQDSKNMSLEEQRQKNSESLTAMAEALANGSFAALFPEGVSHDSPFLQNLKTGAARIFYQACEQSEKTPVIIPVGLHYDQKQRFRSQVLINFHPPIEIPQDLLKIPAKENAKEQYQKLTDEMEKTLIEVIFATESWELHQNLYCAALLVGAERAKRLGQAGTKMSIHERVLGLSRMWWGLQQRKTEEPELVQQVIERVNEYRKDLDAIGIESHELDKPPRVIFKRIILLGLLQSILYLFLLPPFVIVGYIINFPMAILIKFISEKYSDQYKDRASVKLFASVIGYPFIWSLWALGAYFGWLHSSSLFPTMPSGEIWAAIFVFCLGMLGAILMFTYVRAGQRTVRALKIRWKRRQKYDVWLHLQEERSQICDHLLDMAEGIELPGIVGQDGKLRDQ